MIRVFLLLCVFATPALSWFQPGLMARFDITGFRNTSFMSLPRTLSKAISERWIPVVRPLSPPGLEGLELWCPGTNFALCTLFDDTGYIAGIQIAIDTENIAEVAHDWKSQGFTLWTVAENGVRKTFWTTQQYYISANTLATDPYIRIANRDSNTILQDGNVWVSGFDGVLYNISTNPHNFIDREYTTQACLPLMGDHYYYNMSKTTECGEKSIWPWFPIVKNNQLVSVGFLSTGRLTVPAGKTNWFEAPDRSVVSRIVNNGPDCLYKIVDDFGAITLHTYFIENPLLLTC